MKINCFTYNGKSKYKENEYLPCSLIIKGNEIVEFHNGFDVGIYPREFNSELSIIDKIYKSHKANDRIPNGCKYYIQKSTGKGLMNIYLDINKIEYLRLKWGLKKYLIQTNEFKKSLFFALLAFILALIGYWIKKNHIDSEPSSNNEQIINTISKEELDTKTEKI